MSSKTFFALVANFVWPLPCIIDAIVDCWFLHNEKTEAVRPEVFVSLACVHSDLKVQRKTFNWLFSKIEKPLKIGTLWKVSQVVFIYNQFWLVNFESYISWFIQRCAFMGLVLESFELLLTCRQTKGGLISTFSCLLQSPKRCGKKTILSTIHLKKKSS